MNNTNISWTDHTFNPWCGCTKVSPGCLYCYADRASRRNPRALDVWGADVTRNITNPSYWAEPIRWNAAAASNGTRTRVFCGSMCDVFEGLETVNRSAYTGMEEARKRLFNLIDATPNLDWLLLTKRPENILGMWQGGSRPNVWLGTTVECQDYTWRIDALREARNLVPVLFILAEPLIGPVKADFSQINWVIVGGESGPMSKVRRMDLSWAMSIVNQAQLAGAAVFYKQHGSILAREHYESGAGGNQKAWALGSVWNIRQFPSQDHGVVGVCYADKSYFDCCECDNCLNERRKRNRQVLRANLAIGGNTVDIWEPEYMGAIHQQHSDAAFEGETVEVRYRLKRKRA